MIDPAVMLGNINADEVLEDEMRDLMNNMMYSLRNDELNNFMSYSEEFVKAFSRYKELVGH